MKNSGAAGLRGNLMSPVGRLQRPQMARFMAPQVAQRAAQTMVRQSPARGSFGRLGAFGNTAVTQGVTGVKAGVSAAGITTSVGAGVASAIGAGAAAGSVVPIIGTAIGAIVGLVASGVLNHRTDPEVSNFNQATAIWRANRLNALNIANKYLVLAGLFDLLPGQIKGNIPIYKKYGRMGEQRFVTDMMNLIYAAAQAGKITASDTPQSVMTRIVQPWIDSFGFGPMTDTNADLITLIILGMVAEYLAGGQNRWTAVGGDYVFGGVPKFALPAAAAPAPAPSNAPAQPAAGGNASPEGSSLQAGQSGTLQTQAGTWSISGNLDARGNPFAMLNGASTNGGARVLLVSGSQMHLLNDAGWYVWNNGWVSESEPPLGIQKNFPAMWTPAGSTAAPSTSPGNAPTQSAAGTVLQAPGPGAMNTAQGVVTLTADGTWQLNGTAIAYTPAHQSGGTGTVAMQWTGSQLQALNSDGWTGYWNGSTWVTISAANAAAPDTLTPSAGGTSSAPSLTGNPYPAGSYLPTPTYVSTPYTDPSAGSAPAQPAAPIAAGVTGAGLPSWLTWGAMLAGVGILFATARPVGKGARGAKRKGR